MKIRLGANILPLFGNRVAIRITDRDVDDYVKRRREHQVKFIVGNEHRRVTGKNRRAIMIAQ